jgi:hypothetical protein
VTADLELVEAKDGHCDVVYGKYEAKYRTLYVHIIIFGIKWEDRCYTCHL